MLKKIALAALAFGLLLPSLSLRADEEGGMSAKIKEKLGLSDEQASKFRDENKQHHEAMQPLRDKRKGLMKSLEDQVKAEAGDSAIQATLQDLEAVQKEIDTENQRHVDALKAMLNPTQQAKVLLAMRAIVAKEMLN
jgi:hypothetical protein